MFSRVLNSIAELGLVAACLYYLDRAFEWVFRRRLIYFYDIYAQLVKVDKPRRTKNLITQTIRRSEELSALPFSIAGSITVAAERLEKGYICLVVLKKSELIGYGWVALDGYDEDEVRCHYSPQPAELTGWDFDVFIPPERRGSLAFIHVWNAMNEFYAREAREFSMSRISRFNRQSARSHERMGAKRVARNVFVDLGVFVFAFSDTPPVFSVTRRGLPGPTFRITAARS